MDIQLNNITSMSSLNFSAFKRQPINSGVKIFNPVKKDTLSEVMMK